MFIIIPILIILTTKLLPPYDINGSVTPVIGTNPTTTDRFKSVWNIKRNESPNIKYFPNKSVWFIADFIIFEYNNTNNNTSVKAPINPNSSHITEKIKSVCGSGR